MNKENKLVPEFRFPTFKNEGEWDLKEFSNFIKLDRGSSPRPIQEYLTQDVSGVNWIKIGDTKNAKNSVIYQVEEKITPNGAEKSRRVEIGELILANSMSFGKTYELAIEGCIYDGWFVLRKYDKHFIKPFLLQLLNSDFMQNQYKKLSAGGIVQNISSDIVYNSKLFHTSLLEQQKIASCLSSLDEVIAAHSQKLDLLKDHKKGLMQNLFPQEGEKVPKYRFKEFTDSLKKIGFAELGDIKIGLTHKPDYIDIGVPFLSSKNISGGFVDFKNIQHISREKFDSMPSSTKPKLGDILFTRVGSNLGNPIILEEDIEFGIFVSLGFFRVNKKAFNYYIKYWMESDLFWKQVNQKVAGGAKDNLNSTWLKEFELFIPSFQEQQKVASCLSSLDALITVQSEKIKQLKLHKKGLMQGLFPQIND